MSHFSLRSLRRQTIGGAWNGAFLPTHRAGDDIATAAYIPFPPSMTLPGHMPGSASTSYRASKPGPVAGSRAWRALN